MRQSKTLGKGRAVAFSWEAKDNRILITNEKGSTLEYADSEIVAAITWLLSQFGFEPFPLANNVEKLYKNEEKAGLGVALYSVRQNPRFAQCSSYLGVILQELGILQRVLDKGRAIHWRLRAETVSPIGKVVDILQSSHS